MNYNLQQYFRYVYIDISPPLSGTTRGPGAAEMPRPGKEPALTAVVDARARGVPFVAGPKYAGVCRSMREKQRDCD